MGSVIMGWQDDLPQELTVTSNGQSIPLREHSLIKETPDVPTLAKRFYDTHQSMHSRVPLPNGESKPEDWAKWETEVNEKLKAHNYSVVKADKLPKPAPEKYDIKRPDNLPEGAWNDGLEQEAHTWAKKHGLSQDALSEGFGLYMKALGGYGQAVQVNREKSIEKIKGWMEAEGVTAEQVDAALDRFNKDPNGWDDETAELVSKSGFADHPLVVKAIYKLMKDSGTFDTRNDGGSGPGDGDDSSYEDIMKARTDPNHPDHYKAISDDPAWLAKRDAAYKKKFGTKEV